MTVLKFKKKVDPNRLLGYFYMGPGFEHGNNVCVEMRYKPNWFHRKLMYLLLDIKWIDKYDFDRQNLQNF